MDIRFHGHACFSIENEKATIVMDPYDKSIGLTMPKIKADVVTCSFNNEAHNAKDAVEGDPMVLSWPGEYETKGIHFKGIHSFHNVKDDKEQLENVIYTINIDGIRFCHLGAQGTKLTPEQLQQVGDTDILFVPVGKSESIDAKKAKEVIEQIEPRVVIPMTYKTEGNKRNLDSLEDFLSAMGAKNIEPVSIYAVKRSELPDDNSKVVVLNQV